MTKQLTQDDLKNLPWWVKSAAVDEDGTAMGYETFKAELHTMQSLGRGIWHYRNWKPQGKNFLIGKGFDTSDWKNSAIDREIFPPKKTYYVAVWANDERHIEPVELDHEPTDQEMYEIYQDCISNVLDSGYYLLDENDIKEAKSKGEINSD